MDRQASAAIYGDPLDSRATLGDTLDVGGVEDEIREGPVTTGV